jgi:hypothetical protein
MYSKVYRFVFTILVTTSSHENKQIKIKGSNKPDDDETPLLVGHIPEIHYQSLQPSRLSILAVLSTTT